MKSFILYFTGLALIAATFYAQYEIMTSINYLEDHMSNYCLLTED